MRMLQTVNAVLTVVSGLSESRLACVLSLLFVDARSQRDYLDCHSQKMHSCLAI